MAHDGCQYLLHPFPPPPPPPLALQSPSLVWLPLTLMIEFHMLQLQFLPVDSFFFPELVGNFHILHLIIIQLTVATGYNTLCYKIFITILLSSKWLFHFFTTSSLKPENVFKIFY